MFNSTVLEVAAGLCFTFLAVSLATGIIVEGLASITKWRSKTLFSGIKQLVNDPQFNGLAKDLYAHALINPRGPGAAAPTRNWPSYIDPTQFANALMDVVGLSAALANNPTADVASTLPAALQATVDSTIPSARNQQINALLKGVIQRCHGDADRIRKDLADWFDNAMDRVSGAYKRHAQLTSVVVALALCIVLNIDTFRIADTLWAQPGLVHIGNLGTTPRDGLAAVQQLQDSFPIGWTDAKVLANHGPPEFVGWLITALATLFGAPFWFDTLQAVTRLKGSGPSPEEKQECRAAAA